MQRTKNKAHLTRELETKQKLNNGQVKLKILKNNIKSWNHRLHLWRLQNFDKMAKNYPKIASISLPAEENVIFESEDDK